MKRGKCCDSDAHMEFTQVYYWLVQHESRRHIFLEFDQPLTATHIARRVGLRLDACVHLLRRMTRYGLLFSLNLETRHNPLYWLTDLGIACQRQLRRQSGLGPLTHRVPRVPWDLFSSLCYSHRTAALQAMQGPMQAAEIKRRALFHDPRLRMSANNVRDVMRYFLQHGIVRRLIIRRRSHPRFELTDLGRVFRELLVGARGFRPRPEAG